MTSVVFILCGLVFSLSLCGGDMMSGLLPRIHPYDSVSCTYQNFYALFQLSHCLVFPIFLSLLGCYFRGFSCAM